MHATPLKIVLTYNDVSYQFTLNTDVALKKWCKSIQQKYDTKTATLNDVKLSKVYCTNDDGEIGTQFDSGKAKKISKKVEFDGKKASDSIEKETLHTFWIQHQLIQDYCCAASRNTYYIDYLNELLKFDIATFDSLIKAFSKSELRKELSESCDTLEHPFCTIKAALFLIDIADHAPQLKNWSTEQRNAFQVNFILLKEKHSHYFSNLSTNSSAVSDDNILTNAIDSILRLAKRNEFNELSKLLKYLPSSNPESSSDVCSNDNFCLFMKLVHQMRLFIQEVNAYNNPPRIAGKTRRLINTGVDYEKYFTQKQLDRILEIVSDKFNSNCELFETRNIGWIFRFE